MKLKLDKKDLKLSLLMTTVAMVGVLFAVKMQLQTLNTQLPEGLTTGQLFLISIIQSFLMTFVLTFFGLKLARKIKLDKGLLRSLYLKETYKLNKKSLSISLFLGFVLGSIFTMSDRFIFSRFLDGLIQPYSFNIDYFISGVIYGGIGEELLLRLFFMSLLVFIISKLFKQKENISTKVYWVAIILAAMLFALGHLPATKGIFPELGVVVIIRMMLLNGIGGLVFGYLYWKKGLEYAMISHGFTHICTQLLFMPILF
ncbi:MAG: CPBP family intramembrane glutamic endopeptidase [Clostridium sp.]|uniref:CPBP family intramembrane glutamic endopeptidase n=1 Tax=Clostridium sp. TaxID=1506 RepID=UPI003F373C75